MPFRPVSAEKLLTARPTPPFHGSKPAWMLVRYQLLCAMPRRATRPPTLVLLVRHGQTPTTGATLPGRARPAMFDPELETMPRPELEALQLRRLTDTRLYLPAREPYMEGHNTWCVNVPGSLLVIPVADIAQHMLAILCFFPQNGYAIFPSVGKAAAVVGGAYGHGVVFEQGKRIGYATIAQMTVGRQQPGGEAIAA